MWALIKALLSKWALFKVLLKAFGWLAWLIPVAFVLKAIGLPILLLLAVLAAPILIVLAIVGLPILLVFVVGGALLGLLMTIVSFGLAALKIAIPIVLVLWLLNWLFGKGNGDARTTPESGSPATDTPATDIP